MYSKDRLDRYLMIRIAQLMILLSSSYLLSTMTFAHEEVPGENYRIVKVQTFEERYAERLAFHQRNTIALEQAQTRLEQAGYPNIDKLRSRGYSSHPGDIHSYLPFELGFLKSYLPIHLFLEDDLLSKGISRQSILTLMESFRIQLHGPLHLADWPEYAMLLIRLQRYDKSDERILKTKMRYDSTNSSYYFDDTFQAHELLMAAVMELTVIEHEPSGSVREPILNLDGLEGFESIANELEPVHFPRGVSFTHSVRLGNVRLAAGFSWLGRPREILANSTPQFLR